MSRRSCQSEGTVTVADCVSRVVVAGGFLYSSIFNRFFSSVVMLQCCNSISSDTQPLCIQKLPSDVWLRSCGRTYGSEIAAQLQGRDGMKKKRFNLSVSHHHDTFSDLLSSKTNL